MILEVGTINLDHIITCQHLPEPDVYKRQIIEFSANHIIEGSYLQTISFFQKKTLS